MRYCRSTLEPCRVLHDDKDFDRAMRRCLLPPFLPRIASVTSKNIGIIHVDRHADIQEKDLDERMHTTPYFHATNIPNVPAKNLVQIGIGGWQVGFLRGSYEGDTSAEPTCRGTCQNAPSFFAWWKRLVLRQPALHRQSNLPLRIRCKGHR